MYMTMLHCVICRLGAAKAMAMCARSLRSIARNDPALAQEHCLELLQCCMTGLRLAHGDPPGMGTCPAFADAIKVRSHAAIPFHSPLILPSNSQCLNIACSLVCNN